MKCSGTGLGLCSAQDFVKHCGGDIRLQSTATVGTCVDVLLPLTQPPSTPSAHAMPTTEVTSDAANLANKRLLVVEDNDALARTMLLLLSQLKIQAERVGSGDDAYELLKSDSAFDAVLSDIQMPGTIDGHRLARKIREEYPAIVVVLMTGFNDTGVEVTDYPVLQKPFNISRLTECLARLLA